MRDFCISDNKVTLADEASLIIQQIDMLFDTSHGEVLGEYMYGSDFRQFLWDLKASATDISNYTSSKIAANIDMLGWSYDVSTSLMEGVNNDIILITVSMRKGVESYSKTYKVQ